MVVAQSILMLQETYTTTLVFQPTLYWHKRNPPSYFLKRDGGFAYVISKPKKTKASINPLGVDIYIYRYMISLNLRIKTLPATAWGLGITYPQSIKRLGHFITAVSAPGICLPPPSYA